MKKVVFALVLLFQFGHFCSAQEGNRWSVFFERAITLNENDEYEEAEEQFRKAQQSLLEEFGLNEITHATYCNILFRRADVGDETANLDRGNPGSILLKIFCKPDAAECRLLEALFAGEKRLQFLTKAPAV